MHKPLTFAQTRGTKTYHLPFRASRDAGPEMTLMVRRLEDGSYQAGVSVCSLQEPFVRRVGRLLAYHRLNGKPIQGVNSEDLVSRIEMHLHALNENRPDTVCSETFNDLATVGINLDEAFDRLDKNRQAQMVGDYEDSCGC